MSLWSRLKSWWNTPVQHNPSRRSFLLGVGAVTAAALFTTSLPPIQKVLPDIDLGGLLNIQWDLVEHVQQRALEEIMAAEDAKVMALLERLSRGEDSSARA